MRAVPRAQVLLALLLMACSGCDNLPGRPGPGPDVPRPEQVLNFDTLYGQNCTGCHGANGRKGAAVSLADPVYLAFAGEATLLQITSRGVAGKLMPAFGKASGGMLTDEQIGVIVHGMLQRWGRPNLLADQHAAPYAATLAGDAQSGKQVFAMACVRCHSLDGNVSGSILNASYLALVSDQSLRSTIVAGRVDVGMPDWRGDISGPSPRPLTDQEITDTVAWLAAQRTPFPGQPYAAH